MTSTFVGISGSSGFVGTHLKNGLEQAGVSVIGFSRAGAGCSAEQVRQFNLFDGRDRPIDLRGIGKFIHLAGAAHGRFSKEVGDKEYLALQELLTACSSAEVNYFIYVSSAAVYGKSFSKDPIMVDSDPTPQSAYGQAKLNCERLVTRFCRENGMPYIILRLPLVIGNGAPGNLRLLEKLVIAGIPLPLLSFVNRRTVIWQQHISSFIVAQIRNTSITNKTVFLCSPDPVSTSDIVAWMAEKNGIRPRFFKIWGILWLLKNLPIFGKVLGDLVFDGVHHSLQDIDNASANVLRCD